MHQIKEDKIEVELLIIPYHPQIYKTVQEKYPSIIQSEKEINNIAKEHQLFVYGTFNPAGIGFDEGDFRDGLHCTDDGIKKFMDAANNVKSAND